MCCMDTYTCLLGEAQVGFLVMAKELNGLGVSSRTVYEAGQDNCICL